MQNFILYPMVSFSKEFIERHMSFLQNTIRIQSFIR